MVIKQFLQRHLGIKVTIEWPNDLILDNKKVGGILIESKPNTNGSNVVTVGVGLNINQERFPEDLRLIAISLAQYTKKHYDIKDIIVNLSREIVYELKRR